MTKKANGAAAPLNTVVPIKQGTDDAAKTADAMKEVATTAAAVSVKPEEFAAGIKKAVEDINADKAAADKEAAAKVVAVKAAKATDAAKAAEEKKPVVEVLAIPVALLQAAETVAAQLSKEEQALMRGILVHQRDAGAARVVGYAPGVGGRLFVGAFPVPRDTASWLRRGLLIKREGLKTRLSMLAKSGNQSDGQNVVLLHYKNGESSAALTDQPRSDGGSPTMVFNVEVAQKVEQVAVYEHKFTAASFIDLDHEGAERSRKDWDPVGFNSRHMKHCTEIAKLLEGMIPKDMRNENGLVIRTFSSGEQNAPRVFDFDGIPGAVLVVAGSEIVQRHVPLATAKILAPATKLTIAALRAHATRNRAWAAEAKGESAKAKYLADAQRFDERIADILARVPDTGKALAAPAAAAAITHEPDEELDAVSEAAARRLEAAD